MKAFKPRVQVQPAGHFASAPLAFPKLEEAVRHALKFEFTAGGTGTPGQPSGEPSTDRLLIDLGALDAAAFDPNRVIRDCELVRDIAARHPEALRRLLELFGPDAKRDRAGIAKACAELRAIGFTEDHALAAGGGLVWLVVVIGAGLLLGGCGTINTATTGSPTPPVKAPLGQPQPGPSTGPSTGPTSNPGSSPTR
jgi:hypothetical protein